MSTYSDLERDRERDLERESRLERAVECAREWLVDLCEPRGLALLDSERDS